MDGLYKLTEIMERIRLRLKDSSPSRQAVRRYIADQGLTPVHVSGTAKYYDKRTRQVVLAHFVDRIPPAPAPDEPIVTAAGVERRKQAVQAARREYEISADRVLLPDPAELNRLYDKHLAALGGDC